MLDKKYNDKSFPIYNDEKAQNYLNEEWGVKYCQSINNTA